MSSLAAVVRALLRQESQRASGYALRQWTMATTCHVPYLQGQLTLGRSTASASSQRMTLGRTGWGGDVGAAFEEGHTRWHWEPVSRGTSDVYARDRSEDNARNEEAPAVKLEIKSQPTGRERAAIESWLAQLRDENDWSDLEADSSHIDFEEEEEEAEEEDRDIEGEELLHTLQDAVNRHRTPVVALISGKVVHIRRSTLGSQGRRFRRRRRHQQPTKQQPDGLISANKGNDESS